MESGDVLESSRSGGVDVVESEGHFGRPTLSWLGSTESIPGLCPEFETLRYEHSIFYKMKTKL